MELYRDLLFKKIWNQLIFDFKLNLFIFVNRFYFKIKKL